METLLQAFCRRYARRVQANGVSMLTHDGDPLLAAAFKELGWKDQHPEAPDQEVAVTREAPERAVMPHKAKR
jgi:uncharacterized lipoprotein YmbA